MQIERIIWFAMLVSTAIYAVIVYVIAGHPTTSFESKFQNTLVITLYALAVLTFFIATIFPNAMMKDKPQRARMIVALALYESAAIYGLLAAFLTRDWRLYLAPWALCLLGFVRVFPTSEPQ